MHRAVELGLSPELFHLQIPQPQLRCPSPRVTMEVRKKPHYASSANKKHQQEEVGLGYQTSKSAVAQISPLVLGSLERCA